MGRAVTPLMLLSATTWRRAGPRQVYERVIEQIMEFGFFAEEFFCRARLVSTNPENCIPLPIETLIQETSASLFFFLCVVV